MIGRNSANGIVGNNDEWPLCWDRTLVAASFVLLLVVHLFFGNWNWFKKDEYDAGIFGEGTNERLFRMKAWDDTVKLEPIYNGATHKLESLLVNH